MYALSIFTTIITPEAS